MAKAGFIWSLSAVGAHPKTDKQGILIHRETSDSVWFELNLVEVGFSSTQQDVLVEVLRPLQESDEYNLFGAVDVGRFLMVTLSEPWNYYALTGACRQLSSWQDANLQSDRARYWIDDSALVDGHRSIEFNRDVVSVEEIALVASNGAGLLDRGTFVPLEFETVDIMANGRQRYAIYDQNGSLIPAAEPAVSPAGQPGKCMWCHESHLMFGFQQSSFALGLTTDVFDTQILMQQEIISDHRTEVGGAIDYETYDVHEWSERLIESFLAPSVQRIALEWDRPQSEVMVLLFGAGLQWNADKEYAEADMLFRRDEVDRLFAENVSSWYPIEDGTYSVVSVLPSARELSPDQTGLRGEGLVGCD